VCVRVCARERAREKENLCTRLPVGICILCIHIYIFVFLYVCSSDINVCWIQTNVIYKHMLDINIC